MNLNGHWNAAIGIDDYVGQLWRKHRKLFTQYRDQTTIPPEVVAKMGGHRLPILVLTEPYCEDSTQLVPILWKLAHQIDSVELRILRQNEHPDLAPHFLTPSGHSAIPVFIVLGEDGHDRGALVERPPRVTEEIVSEIRNVQETHPDLPGVRRTLDRMPEDTRAYVKQHIAWWRVDQHERWTRYLLEDIAALIPAPSTPATAR